MTGPRIAARLLIASPATAEDGRAVAALLRPYAPGALYRLNGAVAGETEAMVASVLALPSAPVEGADSLRAIEAVALHALGGCVAVLMPGAAVPGLLARALGAPVEAAARFTVAPQAISVLECDDEGRWSVVRVHEGAHPLPDA